MTKRRKSPPRSRPELGCHPLTEELFNLRLQKGITYEKWSEKSGIPVPTLKSWGRLHMPTIDLFERALNAFGRELHIRIPIVRRHVEDLE